MSGELSAFDRVIEALGQVTGHQPRGNATQRSARCPAHDDHNPSLSVTCGSDRVLLKCQADCSTEDVLAALGLGWGDLFDAEPAKDKPVIVAEYVYVDEHGTELFRAERRYPKGFRQKRRGPDGQWVYNLRGVRRVLYRLPEVLKAIEEGRPIWVVEGEKDVHALERCGEVATCNPMGAGKWTDEYTATLRRASEVFIVSDRDVPGRRHAVAVYDSLTAVGVPVGIFAPVDPAKDASDHLAAGHTVDQFAPRSRDHADPDKGKTTTATAAEDTTHSSERVAVVEVRPPRELDQFLNADDPEYDWVVEGLLERYDRLVLTGQEGKGKSTLLRQLGLQLASGIHPFTLQQVEPVRVLLLDLENSERQLRRAFRKIRGAAGQKYKPVPGLHIEVRTQGVDVLAHEDRAWLHQFVTDTAPHILITGPIYKLASGDPTEEKTARNVAACLDGIRADVGCAVILEAHSPHGGNGGRRPERPYGASLWLRWPEFGLYLSPEGYLRPWRGARDEREWPNALRRGGEWPWTVEDNPRENVWAQVVALCEKYGHALSWKELSREIYGVDTKDKKIKTICEKEHAEEWRMITGQAVLGDDDGEDRHVP